MAISEEEEIYQVPIEAGEVYNMAAKYKCCGGRCGTNAGWVWMSAVGTDQVHLTGQYVSTALSCKKRGLIVVVLRSRTITRKLRSKFPIS